MRIKQLREQYGYSQEGIAGIVGMSQTTYSGWEKTFPEQLTRLAALVKHYDVSTDYLLELTNDPTPAEVAAILKEVDKSSIWTTRTGKETTSKRPTALRDKAIILTLFATRTGEPLNRSNLRKLIVRLADRAGVRNASVHRFRHTFAVSFLRNGGNVFALQEILGHARIDTVKIYVRLAERDLADAQRRASPVDNWRL
jgi:integrase